MHSRLILASSRFHIRTFLLMILLSLLTLPAFAKKKDAKNDLVFNRVLDRSERLMNRRQQSLQKALKDGADSLRNYQKNKSEAILNLFGDLHSMHRDAEQVSSVNCSISRYVDFWVSRYLLDGRILADLYLPLQTTDSLFPAVLFLCGHEKTGFETESYVKTAESLARNGIATLLVEPISATNRVQITGPDGAPLTKRTTSEHTLLNNGGLLVGLPIAKEMMRDNLMAFQFLSSLDLIDSTRIGLIGNSGGGAQTSFLSAALGNHIKAVACCSWFTQRQRMLAKYGPDDACQYWPGELARQIDIPDYYIVQAPKPFLVLAGTKDFIDYEGTCHAFNEVKQVWATLGSADCELFAVHDGHGIGPEKREKAVNFFRKYLNVSSPYTAQQASTNDFELISFEEATPAENENNRISSLANQYKPRHTTFSEMSLSSRQKSVMEVTGFSYPTAISVHKLEQNGTLPHYALSRKSDLPSIPFILHENKSGSGIAILLNSKGCQAYAVASPQPAFPSSLSTMRYIIIPDLTGIGSLADDSTKNNSKFMNSDYRTSALAIMLGSSVVTMQTEDIAALALWASDKWKDESITIFSDTPLSIPARHAVLLLQNHKGISSIRIQNNSPAMDWMDIITSPSRPNLLRSIVPNAWKYYNLDELIIQ